MAAPVNLTLKTGSTQMIMEVDGSDPIDSAVPGQPLGFGIFVQAGSGATVWTITDVLYYRITNATRFSQSGTTYDLVEESDILFKQDPLP